MDKPADKTFNPAEAIQRFNAIYSSRADDSPTRRAIFREAYGEDHPEEVAPNSYVTMSLLRRMMQGVAVGSGSTIIDLGCGRAGPSLWIARETGASLVGVDLASAASEHAARRAEEFGVADRARFEVGDCTALRFDSSTFDAAVSVDVLWMIPDRPAAVREAARILKPGARFVFTNWDRDLSPPNYPPPLSDHRPLLQAAGFEIETYDEIPDAEVKRRAIYERYIASETALRSEVSAEALESMLFEARRALGLLDGVDYLSHSRRIFVVARKR